MNRKPNLDLRALGERYQAERADWLCLYSCCDHTHKDIPPLPRGVFACLNHDYSATRGRQLLTLARFAKRSIGGWLVVRADNGRTLGWVYRMHSGVNAGLWSAHVSPGAFRGADMDDEGDLMDRVPAFMFNGTGDNQLEARSIFYVEKRTDAAAAIVGQLVRERAPAVGFGRHPSVRQYRTRSAQHFPIGEGREEHCVCGKTWPGCPDRAALLEAEAAR